MKNKTEATCVAFRLTAIKFQVLSRIDRELQWEANLTNFHIL
jgi:hypothetical protein